MEPKDRIAWERVKQTSASPTAADICVNTLTDINTNILSMDGTHRPALSSSTAWRPQQLLNRSNGSVTFTAKVLQNHDDGDEEEEKEHETHPQVSVTSWEESSGNSGVCRSASDPELQPPIVQELSSSPVIVPQWEKRKLPPSPGLVVRHRTPPPVAPKPTFLLPTRSPPAWGHTVSQDPGVALRPSGLQRGGGSPIPLPRQRVLSLGCVVDEGPGFHLGRGKISQEYKSQREAEAEIPVTILQLHSQQPVRRPSQVTLIEEKERDEEDGEKEERTGVTVRGLMEEERDEENAGKEERNSVTAESPMPLQPNLFEMKEKQEESFNSLFNSRRLANSEMNLVNEILSGPEWSKYLVNQSDTEDTDLPNSKNNRLEMFSFTNDQACDNHYNDDIYEYIATPDTSMQPQQQSEGEIEVKHQGTNQYPERAVREISKPSMHDSGHMSLRTKDTYDTVELFEFSAIKSEPVLDSSAQKDRIRLSKKRKHKKPKFKFRFHGKTTDVKDTGDHSDFSAIKSEAILDSSAQKHRINLSNKRKHQKPKIKFRGHDAGIFSLTKAPLRSSSPPIPSVFYSIPTFIPEDETLYAKPVHRAGGSSPMTKIMTALKGGRRQKEDRNKSKD